MKFTRNRIFGIIGAVWGGAVLVSSFFLSTSDETLSGSSAYAAGHTGGYFLAALMFAVGLYYAIKG